MEPNESPVQGETPAGAPAEGPAPIPAEGAAPPSAGPEVEAAPPPSREPAAQAPPARGEGAQPKSEKTGGPAPREGRGPERRGQGPRQGPRPSGPPRQGGGPGRPDRGPGRPQHQPWSKPDFLGRAVEGGIDRAFLDTALEFARSLGGNLNTNLVRNIYGEVLRQELSGFDPAKFLLLKPRLAYLAARSGRTEMKELRTVLDRGVEKVCADGIADGERASRFERFTRCFEAILAYHKTYERKGGERV